MTVHPCADCKTTVGVMGWEIGDSGSQHPDVYLCVPCRNIRVSKRSGVTETLPPMIHATIEDVADIGSEHFTSQRPFIATAEDLVKNWGGKRDGSRFCCAFDLRTFVEGERVRWVYAPGAPNIFVCAGHDGPDVGERWAAKWAELAPYVRRYGDNE